MRALIRVDSSVRLGIGHLMRCLTLADALKAKGAHVTFACRPLPGNMTRLVVAKGYDACEVPGGDDRAETDELLPDWQQDAAATAKLLRETGVTDWLIVDHYGLDRGWETSLKDRAGRIMVVDDSANRTHGCDLLLDQNYYVDAERRYGALIPESTRTLLGPRYALLRPEFQALRARSRRRDGRVRKVLVFLGGTDAENTTDKALRAARSTKLDVAFHVVVGASNPHRDDVERMCAQDPRFSYQCQAENMAQLMAEADLALGAGGATHWERCYLGLPALVVATATNQVRTTSDLAAAGVCRYLGLAQDLTQARFASALEEAISDPTALAAMSAKAMRIMGDDDTLPTLRVADAILSH